MTTTTITMARMHSTMTPQNEMAVVNQHQIQGDYWCLLRFIWAEAPDETWFLWKFNSSFKDYLSPKELSEQTCIVIQGQPPSTHKFPKRGITLLSGTLGPYGHDNDHYPVYVGSGQGRVYFMNPIAFNKLMHEREIDSIPDVKDSQFLRPSTHNLG